MCSYETIGTTKPNTSGTPVVISPVTGTVISANFFDSGAINPPFFDGKEFVSVCVNGNNTAVITTDVGLDDDTRIKAYPQFAIGTKFGQQSETSFRFYSNTGLPAEHQWPITGADLSDVNNSFDELANLEYVSDIRGIGLPAFTNSLPEINITLDIDEENVVGAERDVMLESWFFDTAANADLLGNNIVTGLPIVDTLNNIIGIGHPHFQELNNTLLEMMVHVGPLSPNDISGASRNPGQNQLTETFSGKDSDGDGIDDHFDVDSHVNANNNLDPQPGVYSSGLDVNGDGIDDDDLLPIQIGSFLYSIWYGESFLSPIVIFSRETNSSLQNDFDPSTPDMNLSAEGEFTLPWNDFLEYTINDLQPQLQALNVAWASGPNNLFSRISLPTGAIGGVEFGVEPQINGFLDLPYSAVVNKFDVQIDGRGFGLADIRPPDTTLPSAETTSITNLSSISPNITDISGTSFDSESGVDRVQVRVQRTGILPITEYWNNSAWQTSSSGTYITASLNNNDEWSLPNVDLSLSADYVVLLRVRDVAGNQSPPSENPITSFSVGAVDTTNPTGVTSINSNISSDSQFDIQGTASDDISGVDRVQVRVQRTGVLPSTEFWDGTAWQTTSSGTYITASLNNNGEWTLPDVDLSLSADYVVLLRVRDVAGNQSPPSENPITNFSVNRNF